MWIFVAVLLFIIAIAITFFIMVAPRSRKKRAGMERLTTPYAHRGLHDDKLPENSLPAFSAAIAAGHGIELDLHLSADGDVVVFHDYTLKRMCGDDILLSSMRGGELSWRRLAGSEYTIPFFEDVLRAVRGRVPILIELKGTSTDTSLCAEVERILGGYDGKYCVQSFNPYLLGWFKKNAPRVARGLLYTDFKGHGTGDKKKDFALRFMLTNFIARPDFVSVDEKSLESFPVKLMRGFFKLPLFVWTVRNPDYFTRYRSMKYGCIFEGFNPGENGGKN